MTFSSSFAVGTVAAQEADDDNMIVVITTTTPPPPPPPPAAATTPSNNNVITNDKNDDEQGMMGATTTTMMIPIVTLNKVPLSPKKTKSKSSSSKQRMQQENVLLVVFSIVVIIAALTFATVGIVSSVRNHQNEQDTFPGDEHDPKKSNDDNDNDNNPPIVVTTTNNNKMDEHSNQEDNKDGIDVGQPFCTQNTDCSSRVCVGNHCMTSLVDDEGLCDDHDDCKSGWCAMFGDNEMRMACCPDGLTFVDMGGSSDYEEGTTTIDQNDDHGDRDDQQLYCATNLPLGAPCRLLDDGNNKDINNNHAVYGSLLNEPPYYYECQLGLSCIAGTCQATPTLLAEREVCHYDSDCFSSSLSAAGNGIGNNNNNNNRGMVCAMASFSAENKICCPQSFTMISTTSNNNKNADDYDLTLCRGQAQVGEYCGTFHELCESGLCTTGQCQEAAAASSSMTIGPIQMYDYGSCERHEDCQSRTCAFVSAQHLGIGQEEEPSPKRVCCPRGKGTFDIVLEDNGKAGGGGGTTTMTFCRHAGSTGTVCQSQDYAQLCSSQLCMNGKCT